jgi:calcineurin-like phosphoesterase family protein
MQGDPRVCYFRPMTIWFTSDQHFDHRNIIEYCRRPFRDVNHMTEMMIAWHNERVAPGDTVWHLGDFALNSKTVPRILPRLNGIHRLVAGNHDEAHPMRSKAARCLPLYLEAGFTSVTREELIDLDGLGKVRLCHMPYSGDSRQVERYQQWRPVRGEEVLLLHGHVHEAWRESPGTLNVGVDVWNYRPVSLEEVRSVVLYKSDMSR